ncbi:MAG: cyclodeaminase/cyclohydrolase family protein, partial [Candidatus Marinimicrobia bacterium]|nr:cyclodeaminase/cyclohydrolase family protein [Candidatus Neomarinimicrobiota bacterium]
DPDFAPDFGEPVFLPKSGATAVGARAFMLAYNINLNTKDLKAAQDIAMTLRSSGRAKRDVNGNIVRDKHGKPVKIPGKLKFCQAGGWYIEEYGYAQVTMNLHRIDITGLHTAFDTVVREAAKKGLRVTGSELIGLAPLQAMLDAGEHYLRKQGASTACPEKEIIHCAVRSLGLADTSPFDPQKRIVEYALKNEKGRLKHLSVNDFTDLLSSNAPAPGGGSVAALNAALAAGLSAMVANLTFENKHYADLREDMEKTGRDAQRLKARALSLIDEDTAAFNAWMNTLRLPKKTAEEKAKRDAAVQSAVLGAINIPLDTLKLCPDILKAAEFVLKKGNQNALSDAAVGLRQAQAAAWSAYYNILINLPSLDDPKKRESIRKTAQKICDAVEKKAAGLTRYAEEKLNHAIG